MTVQDIIREHLKANGFDGLCKAGCGCSVEDAGDLCDGDMGGCVPAYNHTGDDCSQCECDCDSAGCTEISAICYREDEPVKKVNNG